MKNHQALRLMMEAKKIEHSGCLTKEGKVRQSRKLRYFVLTGDKFYYYVNTLTTEPKGVIPIDKDTKVTEIPEKGFCFKLSRKYNRTFILFAENEKEMKDWVDILNIAIKQRISTQSNIQSLVSLFPKNLSEIISIRHSEKDEIIEIDSINFESPLSPGFQRRNQTLKSQDDTLRTSYRNLPQNENNSVFQWKIAQIPKRHIIVLCYVPYVIAFELIRILFGKFQIRIIIRKNQFIPLSNSETRFLEKFGAEIVNVDYKKTFSSVFEGARKIYIYSDFDSLENNVSETILMLEAAEKNKIRHIIKSSFLGTEPWEKYPNSLIENSKISFTFLKINFFMQTFLVEGIKNFNQFSSALKGTTKVSWLDARDVSYVVKNVLESEKYCNKTYLITGPQSLSPNELSEIFSRFTSSEIKYFSLSDEQSAILMQESGIPIHLISSHLDIWKKMKDQQLETISPEMTSFKREPIKFEQFVKDHINLLQEDYLKYFAKDSEEFNFLLYQFQQICSKFKPKNKKVIYDGVDKNTFTKTLSFILNDTENKVSIPLWNFFKTSLFSNHLSFIEYANGMGKLNFGPASEKIEICLSMYEHNGTLSDRAFLSACSAIHLFSMTVPIPNESHPAVFSFFASILSKQQTIVTTHKFRIKKDLLKKEILNSNDFMKLLGLKEKVKINLNTKYSDIISFGQPKWEFLENVLYGIQKSTQLLLSDGIFEVTENDYEFERSFDFLQPSREFHFIDYAPIPFHLIRNTTGIPTEEYLVCIAANVFKYYIEIVRTC